MSYTGHGTPDAIAGAQRRLGRSAHRRRCRRRDRGDARRAPPDTAGHSAGCSWICRRPSPDRRRRSKPPASATASRLSPQSFFDPLPGRRRSLPAAQGAQRLAGSGDRRDPASLRGGSAAVRRRGDHRRRRPGRHGPGRSASTCSSLAAPQHGLAEFRVLAARPASTWWPPSTGCPTSWWSAARSRPTDYAGPPGRSSSQGSASAIGRASDRGVCRVEVTGGVQRQRRSERSSFGVMALLAVLHLPGDERAAALGEVEDLALQRLPVRSAGGRPRSPPAQPSPPCGSARDGGARASPSRARHARSPMARGCASRRAACPCRGRLRRSRIRRCPCADF